MNEHGSLTQGLSSRRKAYDITMRTLLYASAIIICALLVFLIGYILYRGVPNLSWQFITSEESVIRDIQGILPALINTLYIIVATLIFILPLGVGSAIYLTEYASNKKLVARHRVRHRDPGRHAEHHLRARRRHSVLRDAQPRLYPHRRRVLPRHDDSADYHPHHAGVAQDCAPELPRGLPRPGKRQVAHDTHRRPPLQHRRHSHRLHTRHRAYSR